jgi:PAS domain S-box-containing protein
MIPANTTPNYELLIQGVVDYAIYLLSPEGRVISWNPGAERIKQYTAGEIIGEHFSRFYSHADQAAGLPAQALKTAIEEGRFVAEAWRYRKDGSRFWAAVVIDPIFKAGELAGFAKITRDMSEQRETQRQALESERRFRLLVQGVVDYAIYMLSPDGRVTNWNAGAERIKGYRAEEIIGEHFSQFYTAEDVADGVPQRALKKARDEGSFQTEGWRVRKDGSRFWASVVIDAIYDDGELIGFAKVTRDLSERQRSQEELDRSRAERMQSQKMEAIGQLTGGLAHDFNNLLAGITGNLEVLKDRLSKGRFTDLERYIDAAHASSTRAAALTHRLLAFARRQALDPKPVEANKLIAQILTELISPAVGPSIEARTDLAEGLWLTLCDPNQLENALLNLAINARDAMPHGGRLTIESRNVSIDEGDAVLTAGDYVLISVVDGGTGMSADVTSRAFDPFYTTKPFGAGTGLGLSMVHGFARQSGGDVKIDTHLGKGTAIRVYLPRFEGIAEEPGSNQQSGHLRPTLGGKTIVVVDDEPMVRMLMTDVLREAGYIVLEASDGSSGLKILQSDANVSLLVTDVGLPGSMNGRQLADAARGARPDLKVLFVTGYAESAAIGEGRLELGMSVLAKPFAIEGLVNKVSAILA